jgi:hypothetical protein
MAAQAAGLVRERELSEQLHPMAPHHLPFFITAPGQTDVLLVATGLLLIGVILWVGTLYWRLHSLPERIAHKSQKLQFEIVAILGLISLFTHNHLFWIAGLLLALIEVPDFGTPLNRIAGSVEKIAGSPSSADAGDAVPAEPPVVAQVPKEVSKEASKADTSDSKVRSHA